MIKYILTYACIAISTIAVSQTKVSSPQFTSETDSVSYAFGANIADGLKNRGVKELNYQLVAKAMADVFAAKSLTLDQDKCLELIQSFLQDVDKQKFDASIAEEKEFLANNKTQAGVIALPSGLQYQIITPGSGSKPLATDKVTVHYRGTLVNGFQFDSSYDRGEPINLTLNQVIPGWTEGLQLMPVGSKYKFFIPSELGYGSRGGGDQIPPYSTLIFDVELISIDQ